MSEWLDPAFSGRLCLTLLHSVWLVAVFTAIAWGTDRIVGKRSAERSYVLYTSALMLSVIAIPITWWCVEISDAASIAETQSVPLAVTASEIPSLSNIMTPGSSEDDVPVAASIAGVDYSGSGSPPESATASSVTANWLGFAPWLVVVYLGGVVLMLLRLARSVRQSQLSRRTAEALTSGPLAALVEQLSQRWAMRVTPVLMQVKGAIVPQVIGLLRPIILLPMSAVNELSAEELELILTHEMAHILRHDMWIHLVQRLTEILLFFNPALWLLSHRISAFREYCCDDITCKTAGEPEPEIRYATALLRILEVTTSAPESQVTALAVTGRSPSEVRRRIERLFNEPLNEPVRLSRSGFVACLASLAVLFVSAKLWTAEPEPITETLVIAQPEPTQQAQGDDVAEELFRLFVSGPDGRPVADAFVEFRGSPKLRAQQIRRGTFDHEGSYGTFVKTDQNGRVTISLLDGRPSLRISIKKSGYGPFWTDWSSKEQPDRFTANLDKAWRVGGIVVDENGKYRITGCEELNVRIVVSAEGYATDMQEHQVASDMQAVDFQLKQGGHVRVRVVDKNGKGINRARIFFQKWRGPIKYFEFSHIDQYTDIEGIWEWNQAPLDEFKADISGPNSMRLLSQPLIARDKEYVFSPPELLVISGKVVDARTKEPVPRFRVVPGSRNEPGRGTDDWWTRDESYEAKDGRYEIVRDDAAPTHMLRIEAPGYKMIRSRDILNSEGKVDISFELTPAENISVQLLTDEGKPASHAEVAVAIAGSQISLDKGQITDRSTFATRITADENGRFELSSRDDDFQLLATHPEGFAMMKPKNGLLPKTVTLNKFAKIEGVFLVGGKVGRGVRLSLQESQVYAWGDQISAQNETVTDNDGRFVFERVIPGRGFLGPEMHSMVGQGHSKAMSSRRTPIQSLAGQTTTMTLGGDGRLISGRLVPPKEHSGRVLWNFANIHVEAFVPEPEWPVPPDDVRKDEAAAQKWWAAWQVSDAGKVKMAEVFKRQEESRNLPTFWVSAAKDGTFQIDDMQPGKYVLKASFDEHSPGQLPPFQFEVPKFADGDVGKPLDIGKLQMEK